MKTLVATVDHDYIINADETGWKLFPRGILSWGETFIDSSKRDGTLNEKTQVTVLASITLSGTKLPLLFIAQGKTARVESTQIGDVNYHWKTHTESGWMDEQAFSFYLMKLREHFNDDKTIHLVMDLYPSHMTEEVKQTAEACNICFHIIPAGYTDVYQPLDRKIFGPLKALARKFFARRQSRGKPISATKLDACQDMVAAWEHVTPAHIPDAWDIYLDDEDSVPRTVQHERELATIRKSIKSLTPNERHHRGVVKATREASIRKRIETRSMLD